MSGADTGPDTPVKPATPDPADPASFARHRWLTPERYAWLRERYGTMPTDHLAERFSFRFGVQVSGSTIKSANRKWRFGRGRRGAHVYGPRETEWLIARLPTQPHDDTIREFALEFGWTPTKASIHNFCQRHPAAKGAPQNRFQRGMTPWNKGRKGGVGGQKINPGQFRPGGPHLRSRPLHSERRTKNNGQLHIEVKIPWEWPDRPDREQTKWIRKAVWVWMQAHDGKPVPDGHAIIHRDGDVTNCALENLECISRRTLMHLNSSVSARFAGPEHEPTRIENAKLRTRLQEVLDEVDPDRHKRTKAAYQREWQREQARNRKRKRKHADA